MVDLPFEPVAQATLISHTAGLIAVATAMPGGLKGETGQNEQLCGG
jgi:hypothetical protein